MIQEHGHGDEEPKVLPCTQGTSGGGMGGIDRKKGNDPRKENKKRKIWPPNILRRGKKFISRVIEKSGKRE